MPRRSFLLAHLLVASLVANAATPRRGAAQQVLDWPVRTDAMPEALTTGASAAFWNPAMLAPVAGRLELMVVDLDTPDAVGLNGTAAAGAFALLDRLTLGLAYQHDGVGGMTVTDGPPIDGAGPDLEVAEDVFVVAVASRPRARWSTGASLRYVRPSDLLGTDATLQAALGAGWDGTAGPARIRAAASLLGDRQRLTVRAGLEAGPAGHPLPVDVSAAWGLEEREAVGVAHRLVLRGVWRQTVDVQLGVTAEPSSADRTWSPLLAGSLRLGRYVVSVVRESLPAGFGAVMHYRLSVLF